MPKVPTNTKTRRSRRTLKPVPFGQIPDGYHQIRVPEQQELDITLKRKRYVRFEPIGDNSKKGYGLPLSDLLSQQGLVDPGRPIFETEVSNGKAIVTVSLQWPGYTHLPWIIDIELVHPSGELLTRVELGYALALQVVEFIDKCHTHEAFVPTDEFWRVGFGGFNMDTIRFWNLWTADDDIWYLSFHVLAPLVDLSFLQPCSEDEDGQQNDGILIPSDPEEIDRFVAWYTHCGDSEMVEGIPGTDFFEFEN